MYLTGMKEKEMLQLAELLICTFLAHDECVTKGIIAMLMLYACLSIWNLRYFGDTRVISKVIT